MKYSPIIYENTDDNSSRFVLGNIGENPLCVVGLNPSTADDKEPDHTMKKVMGFATCNGYDSFIMFNLYPLRSTNPQKLSKERVLALSSQNIKHIRKILESLKAVNLLAAWGETITVKSYLLDCLHEINDSLSGLNINWLKIGDLTTSNHPRHPSRAGYDNKLTKFNITAYLFR